MNKKTIKSLIIMGLSSIFGYFVTLFLASYITENIGIEAYGFVSIAKTFVDYGGIITVALTSFIVRYITINYHKNDIKEANSYYVSSINACVILCIFLCLIFIGVIVNLQHLIKIPDYLVPSVKILFVMVFLTFEITTLATPFGTGFYISNRLDLSGIIKIIAYLVEILSLVILFLFFKPSVWFAGFVTLVAALTNLLLTYSLNKKLIPDFKYKINLHSNKKVFNLIKNGIWNSINQLGNTLNSGLDLIVSNSLLNGIQTGQIAIAKSIGAIFGTLSAIIFQPLQPELLRTYAQGINDTFLNQLKKSMKLCGFFGGVAFAGFFAMGSLFYKLWLPTQNSQLLHILTLLTVFTYIMDIFLQPLYYVSTLTVKNIIPCFVTILGGILNVFGMIILIKYTSLEIYSVPITTAVIMFLINFFFNPIYASWCLKISKWYFYPIVFKHLFSTFCMCLSFKIISVLLSPNSWITLVLVAMIMVIIGVITYFMVMFNNKEKAIIVKMMKDKVFKKNVSGT